MPTSPIVETVQTERLGQESIDLERPAPTYVLKTPIQEFQTPEFLVVQHLTDDERVRDRVRTFSNHIRSVYSQPTSPIYPAHIFTDC